MHLSRGQAVVARKALKRGRKAFFRGDMDAAIAACDYLIQLCPDFAEAYQARGVYYCRKGEADKAIADCDEALRLQPDLANAYRVRGHAYELKGSDDEAIADYTEFIRLKPGKFIGPYYRGNVYLRKGDYDRAIADYSAAIEIAPGLPFLYRARGNAYSRKGEPDRAKANRKWGRAIVAFSRHLSCRRWLDMWRVRVPPAIAIPEIPPDVLQQGVVEVPTELPLVTCWQTTVYDGVCEERPMEIAASGKRSSEGPDATQPSPRQTFDATSLPATGAERPVRKDENAKPATS